MRQATTFPCIPAPAQPSRRPPFSPTTPTVAGLVAALVVAVLLGSPVLPATAPAATTGAARLDDHAATAVAFYGTGELWVQAASTTGSASRELVYRRSPSAAPRVLPVVVPAASEQLSTPYAQNLGLGRDGSGVLTLVIQGAGGLFWAHVSGSPALHVVAGTDGDDVFPSLFGGRIAYTRLPVGGAADEVVVGSLTKGIGRVAWTNRSNPEFSSADTAVGAGGSVVFVTARDGAGNGEFQLRLVAGGHPARTLTDLELGRTQIGGLAIRGVSTDGTRVTVIRTVNRVGREIGFALPSGRKT
jgi:hypothetical protein